MNDWLRRALISLLILAALLLVGPFLIPVPPLEGLQRPQDLAGPGSRFITLTFSGTDGIDMHFRQAGTGAPVFVLLHGFASNLYTWDNSFDFFAARGTTYAYDRPPFGLSERLLAGDWDTNGPNPYTTAAAVHQLFAFLDAQDVDQAILVGNSAGGLIALQATQTRPERVTALILIDPAVYNSGAPTFLVPFANTPQLRRLGPLIARAFASNEALLELAYHDPLAVPPETIRKAALTTRVEGWDAAFWQFTAAATSAQHVVDRITATTTPTLVITGANDRIVSPEDSARLAAELQNATFITIPNCGHVPHDECPEPFQTAVAAWLDRLPSSTGR